MQHEIPGHDLFISIGGQKIASLQSFGFLSASAAGTHIVQNRIQGRIASTDQTSKTDGRWGTWRAGAIPAVAAAAASTKYSATERRSATGNGTRMAFGSYGQFCSYFAR